MFANKAKTFLQLGRCGIFQPPQLKRLKLFPQTAGFDRGEAMVGIVQHVNFWPEFFPQAREKLRHKAQVMFGRPLVLQRRLFFRGFVAQPGLLAASSVGTTQSWNARLRADSFVSEAKKMAERADGLAGVRLLPAGDERLVGRDAGDVRGEVRHVGARHLERRGVVRAVTAEHLRLLALLEQLLREPAAPVRALVQILPRVLDAACIASD